jgi:type II secretory pathway component GspD/PulD (secretin)
MVVVRVTAGPGLRVTNARDGVAYRGPLYQGEALKVPLRLLAWKAGTHRLRVQLQSDVAGVAGDLEITISDFVGEIGKNGETPVSLSFNETPSRKAIRQLAAAAGARVVIHEDIERKLVTLDFSAGVPFAAALRILCDDCGYHLRERNGVYHVLR